MLLCRAVSDIFEEELFTTAFAAVSMIGTLSNAVTWVLYILTEIEGNSARFCHTLAVFEGCFDRGSGRSFPSR